MDMVVLHVRMCTCHCMYSRRKYFKTRSHHLQSDNVILDKFEARQLNCKVQFDPFNCGVFSLKVAIDFESPVYVQMIF